MTDPHQISVVIPAFNAEPFLAETIDSVLAQTLPPREVIVVDDASDDRTAEIAASYREVTLSRLERNEGPAGARNAGFRLSSGSLVCFGDADDVMLPRKLEVQAEHLERHPEAGVVLVSQTIEQEAGADLPFWHRDTDAPVVMPLRRRPADDPTNIHLMTMMMRRETFDLVGPFDPETSPAEDVDWMLRAREAGVEIARLPDVLVRRRVHAGSLTQDAIAARRAILRAFKARIERRRSQPG